MLVQAGLCRTCLETTLLVFPRGGSCFKSAAECPPFVLHYENTPMQHTEFFKFENFQKKKFNIFLIFAQNMDCGYKLELPQRGESNEYPQSMFWSKTKKTRFTPANSSFAI